MLHRQYLRQGRAQSDFTRADVYAVALFRLMTKSGFNRAVAGEYVAKFIRMRQGRRTVKNNAHPF